MNEKDIVNKVRRKFKIEAHEYKKKKISIKTDGNDIIGLCRYLKGLGFEHLSAISVTDFINKGKYELIYFLWSYQDNISLIAKVEINREKPAVDSVVNVWNEAQIHERELHELFGVNFIGNHDLSELFLEGWEGKPPFRKDFDWREYVRKKYYKNSGRETSYYEVGP